MDLGQMYVDLFSTVRTSSHPLINDWEVQLRC